MCRAELFFNSMLMNLCRQLVLCVQDVLNWPGFILY